MILNNDENHNELFRTDVKFQFINLNERYKVRNKFKQQFTQAGNEPNSFIDKWILLYRDRKSFNHGYLRPTSPEDCYYFTGKRT